MKNFLFIIITIMCLISSIVLSIFYSMSTPNTLNSFNQMVTIMDNPNFLSNELEFYTKIENIAKDNDVNIARAVYDYNASFSSTKNTYYIMNSENNSNIKLRSGNYLNQYSNQDQYMSSVETNNPNQVGLIEKFDSTSVVEVHPFVSQCEKGLPTGFNCYVLSNNKESVKQFETQLNSAGIKTKGISDTNFSMSQSVSLQSILPYLGIFFLSVYVLFIIVLIYYLISQYKFFAIQKLFGITSSKIRRNIIIDFLKLFLCAEIINFGITTIMLGFYNSFSFYFEYISIWVLTQFMILIITILMLLLVTITINRIKVAQMLKNKKPVTSSKVLNLTVKIIFSCVAIATLSLSFQNLVYLANNNPNLDKWEQTKNYAKTFLSSEGALLNSDDHTAVTKDYYYRISKMLEFVKLSDDKGGVLIAPSDNYYPEFSWQYPDKPDYSPVKQSITVNNNYLKANEIIDINGNVIDFPDENNYKVNLLVPEKYKQNEQEIIDLYNEYVSNRVNILNYVLESITNDKSTQELKTIEIEITYVKNNQQYFSYNTDFGKENNNDIEDPIAIVLNKNTYDSNTIGSGNYLVKVDDVNNITGSLTSDLEKTQTKSILLFQSVYRKVDSDMNKIKNEIMIQIIIIIFAMTVLIMIILTTIINYLEQNKNINAVKRIHGYSFFYRHLSYYIILLCTWIGLFTGLSVVSVSLNLSFSVCQILIFSTGLFLFETLISIPIIKLKEMKKTKDVLKGE